MKLAVAGRLRNYSEVYVTHFGGVAIKSRRREIYLGGAHGGSVRRGHLLSIVSTH